MFKSLLNKLRVFMGLRRQTAKSRKQHYKPGTLGLSAVSKAIQAEYGSILSRQQRKYLARKIGKAFKPFSAKA